MAAEISEEWRPVAAIVGEGATERLAVLARLAAAYPVANAAD